MTAKALAEEIELHVRARYPILYLVTHEEVRVEQVVAGVAERLSKQLSTWSVTRGVIGPSASRDGLHDPLEALARVRDSTERALFLFRDLHRHMDDARVVRMLRDLAEDLRLSQKTLLIVAPVLELPRELEKDVHVIDVPLPSAAEIEEILERVLSAVRDNPRVEILLDDQLRERVVQAALGLTATEVESIFGKAVVEGLRFDDSDLDLILAEKRQIIRKGQLLEYLDFDESLDTVGGLARLKHWLAGRQSSFSERARAFGLPEPRGVLLLGVQGCGKSLSAKAIASQWRLPLLRMDVGSVFGPYIGTSEENMRRAIRTAESLAPCVLWLDEIEKAFGGVSGGGGGSADSGTSLRVLATFLTWIQEKTHPVFVVATANSIELLPPEMLRKGRFDEIFFVDLPEAESREQIFAIHLRRRRRDPARFALSRLAESASGMSGAEIEQVVVSALHEAFADGERELSDGDLERAIAETVPLSVTMRESIDALREWASTRARPAD